MSDVSLRDLFEARLAATEEALRVARIELERRLESMNEFREQLRTQASTFIARTEFDLRIQRLEEMLKDARKGKVGWGTALAITVLTSLALSLIVWVVTH